MNELVLKDDLKILSEKVFDFVDISEATRRDYKYYINQFVGFIKRNGLHVNSYLDYKRYLSKRNDLAIASKNKCIYVARVFLKELNRLGIIPSDITQNIKGFKQTKKHRRTGLNDEEIERLTEKIKLLDKSPKNSRLKAIISLLLFQGLRQIEIVRLNVSDIDFAQKLLMVKGKGQDDLEPIDLHPQTVKHLREYLRINKIKSGAVFVSFSNHKKNQRLSTRSLRGMVKEILRELKIENKSTHGFRHTFTTKLIQNFDGNLIEVAKFTRHKSLETLQIYNDRIQTVENLPRYYETFDGISF